MAERCEGVVYFYQGDEETKRFIEGIRKIEDFFLNVLQLAWNYETDLDEYDGAEGDIVDVSIVCWDHVGRIFEGEGKKLLEIMKEYGIASKWKGVTDLSGSVIEISDDGIVGKERYFSFEDAIYDKDGEPIEYSEDDFDRFMDNMNKCLDEERCTEKENFHFDDETDNWREIFNQNYDGDLRDAISDFINNDVWPFLFDQSEITAEDDTT